jgi:hypothetical protein
LESKRAKFLTGSDVLSIGALVICISVLVQFVIIKCGPIYYQAMLILSKSFVLPTSS